MGTPMTLQVGVNYLACKQYQRFTLALTAYIRGNLDFVDKSTEGTGVSYRLVQHGETIDFASWAYSTSSVTKKADPLQPYETTRTWL